MVFSFPPLAQQPRRRPPTQTSLLRPPSSRSTSESATSRKTTTSPISHVNVSASPAVHLSGLPLYQLLDRRLQSLTDCVRARQATDKVQSIGQGMHNGQADGRDPPADALFGSNKPSNQDDARVLAHWLSCMFASHEQKKLARQSDTQDDLAHAVELLIPILSIALHEVVRQLTHHCLERSVVLEKVWRIHNDLFAKALTELRVSLREHRQGGAQTEASVQQSKREFEEAEEENPAQIKKVTTALTTKFERKMREINEQLQVYEDENDELANQRKEQLESRSLWFPGFDSYNGSCVQDTMAFVPALPPSKTPEAGLVADFLRVLHALDPVRRRRVGISISESVGHSLGGDRGQRMDELVTRRDCNAQCIEELEARVRMLEHEVSAARAAPPAKFHGEAPYSPHAPLEAAPCSPGREDSRPCRMCRLSTQDLPDLLDDVDGNSHPSKPDTPNGLLDLLPDEEPEGVEVVVSRVSRGRAITRGKTFTRLGQRAREAPITNCQSLTVLADYLTKPAATEEEQAWVIFNWVCHHIRIDAGLVERGPLDAEGILERRCTPLPSGYASVFEKLASMVGLTVHTVAGSTRTMACSVGEVSSASGDGAHAWNVVKLRGEWLLVDCARGSGSYLGEDEREVQAYWFGTPPEQFAFDHFPGQPEQQLLPKPLTRSRYSEQPILDPCVFFCLGLRFTPAFRPSGMVHLCDSNDGSVQFYVPKNIRLTGKVDDDSRACFLPPRATEEGGTDVLEMLSFRLPLGKVRHNLDVYAHKFDKGSGSGTLVCRFAVIGPAEPSTFIQPFFPIVDWAQFHRYEFAFDRTLPEGLLVPDSGEVRLEFQAPPEVFVGAHLGSRRLACDRKGNRVVIFADAGSTTKKLRVSASHDKLECLDEVFSCLVGSLP